MDTMSKDELRQVIQDYLDEVGLSSLIPILKKEHNLIRKTHKSGLFAVEDLNNVSADAKVDGDLLTWEDVEQIWTTKSFAAFLAEQDLTHALLSTKHSDTEAAAVVRGDLAIGQGAPAKWKRKAIGTANMFLKSDGTDAAWATINQVPAGAIMIFKTSCPTGWTRVSAWDGYYLKAAATYDATPAGALTHRHYTTGFTDLVSGDTSANHNHSITKTTAAVQSGTGKTVVDSVTSPTGNQSVGHTHASTWAGAYSDYVNHEPPNISVVYCEKDA